MKTDLPSLIECVPNFSEGRNSKIIDDIVLAIESVPGVKVLHVDMGYDANRTVITFVGDGNSCQEAAFRSILRAYQLIDMTLHHGTHPRLGAVDVFPFIPLGSTKMQEAIDRSVLVGKRVADELNVPVFLYNESATIKSRRSIATIRKGEYEGLADKLNTDEGKPDFGSNIFNPGTGALIIGARKILVAYNFNLNTKDKTIAKKIAEKLRGKNSGLKGVRAIGWYMDQFKCAQVSTNLIDLNSTPLYKTYEYCNRLANDMGVQITGSELVGMIPLIALTSFTDYFKPKNGLDDRAKVNFAAETLGLNSVKAFVAENQIMEWAIAGEIN